nr:hypothetical protein HmN_001022200 [Hymenolepis microstoma]
MLGGLGDLNVPTELSSREFCVCKHTEIQCGTLTGTDRHRFVDREEEEKKEEDEEDGGIRFSTNAEIRIRPFTDSLHMHPPTSSPADPLFHECKDRSTHPRVHYTCTHHLIAAAMASSSPPPFATFNRHPELYLLTFPSPVAIAI